MKFKINKEHFSNGLRQVINVVGSKPQTAVLNNVLIKADSDGITLTTTNLDLGIRCSIVAEVSEPGEITLPCRKLASIVSDVPMQEITVESSDGQVARVKSGKFSSNINGLKAEDFPALPNFVNKHAYKLAPQELLNMLRSVSYAQSTDENRYILNSVFFSFAEDKLTLVATDGRRLAMISRDIGSIDRDDEGSIILPAKTVSELEKLLGQGKELEISFSERQVAFDIKAEGSDNGLNGSIYLVSKIVEGSYPNYKQVIPKEAEHRVKLERELMRDTVRRVSKLTSEKHYSVRLNITQNSLEVFGESAEGSAKETIDIEYEGPEVKIGFNPEYLIQPLDRLTKDEVFFEFKDEMSPGVFKTLDSFMCVVMPLRV